MERQSHQKDCQYITFHRAVSLFLGVCFFFHYFHFHTAIEREFAIDVLVVGYERAVTNNDDAVGIYTLLYEVVSNSFRTAVCQTLVVPTRTLLRSVTIDGYLSLRHAVENRDDRGEVSARLLAQLALS